MTAQVVVGRPCRSGVILPAEGLVLVTEEARSSALESTGERSATSAADKVRPFLADDLRSLDVGDFVVHVEHGIGRYQGLVHKEVAGLTVDLLVVEYAGGDRLYLPVYRLNQIQKFSLEARTRRRRSIASGSHLREDSLARREGGAPDGRRASSSLRRAQGPARSRARGRGEDDYRAFEATFSFEETQDLQARAIDDVNKDLGVRPADGPPRLR